MHVGLIPDGNRRYMRKRGITNLQESYRMGITKFYDFLEWCRDLSIKETTIYALSLENIMNRSREELKVLFSVFEEQATKALTDDRIHDNKVKVNVCGDMNYLATVSSKTNGNLVKKLNELEDVTRNNKSFTLNLAIAYGGRQEVLNAARSVVSNSLELSEDNLKKYLWVKNYPEIVIRTAEDRLSNFLLWQSAYSEIYFIDKLWQEFEKNDLAWVVQDYNSRERRFGR